MSLLSPFLLSNRETASVVVSPVTTASALRTKNHLPTLLALAAAEKPIGVFAETMAAVEPNDL
jgi:hypothetical protein